jgi:hypothetical protein
MVISRDGTARRARHGLAVLSGLAVLLTAAPAEAQQRTGTRPNPETTPRERAAKDAPQEPGPLPMSKFGADLTGAQAGALLLEMRQLADEALAASRVAEQAQSVAGVKAGAERVLQAIWGLPSGHAPGDGAGEINVHGWKEYWQVTGGEFDPAFVQRYGAEPPKITDPRRLGIVGRGRAVRGYLDRITGNASKEAPARKTAANQVAASLGNVVGWMYVTTGFKGKEVQPRISLTYVWDAPSAFWNSSADTGWLHDAYAQAVNILKADYHGDAAEARRHAADLTILLLRVIDGVDVDGDGAAEAQMMEGGLKAALGAAVQAGLEVR